MPEWLPILFLPYFILVLDIYRHLIRLTPHTSQENSSPFISVVVACRNEQENIPDLLMSLARQEYPLNSFEVIIVDDHSTDQTPGAARAYEYLLNLKIVLNQGRGKKLALKSGITAAKADLIVTTDADCRPPARWLKTIASLYAGSKPDMIICPVRLSPVKGFFGRFQELEFLSLQGITAGAAAGKNAVMCNGANLAFTKDAYFENEVNLRYDIATGDDVFLLHSMKKRKSGIVWLDSADAIVETMSQPDLASFLKQRKRWASKATAYRDTYSILMGIVTFVTNLALAFLAIAAIFNTGFLKIFLISIIIKSIPDFLVLMNTAKRYGRRKLMWWFVPCQVVYPFYVIIVSVFGLLTTENTGNTEKSTEGSV